MATVTHSGTLPDSAGKTDFYSIIDNATVTGIVNADIAAGAAIVDTKLAQLTTASKVSGTALIELANIPVGAGNIPAANLGVTGTIAGVKTFSSFPITPSSAPTSDYEVCNKKYRDTRLAGETVQVVNYQTGALATGSTTIPIDDTIPQITEGNEYMTLAITPTSATNKLKIDVVINVSNDTNIIMSAALFQDATASALAAITERAEATNELVNLKFTHYMTAGTTSETTFRVRAGCAAAGTTSFNGENEVRIFGGVLSSSITITEIKV